MKIVLGLFMLLATFIHCSEIKPQPDQPNIIILYADDMGYGDVSSQNPRSKIKTPHIDQLAESGMRFTDGHSSSGICTPSRYAMLTGRHHWRDFHGIVGPMGAPAFQENQYTMAQMLGEQGYRTACIGKWHLGWHFDSIRDQSWTAMDSMKQWNRTVRFYPPEAYDWTRSIPGGPLDRGFDHYYGDGTINFPPYAFIHNDKVTKIPTATMRTPKGLALEGSWEARPGPAVEDWNFFDVLPAITEHATQYVLDQKGKEEPFFLYVPFSSPHAPIIPNEEFQGSSEAGPFGDFVQQTDWSIGQILGALKEIGEEENTIVIFTADNGPERYAYERIQKYDHHSSAPFRGLKRDIYEGGHHVPFIVRWPKKISSGSSSSQVISQVDLLKTLASLLDAELPQGLKHDSHDFSEVWLGGQDIPHSVRKFTVQNTFEGRYALREGNWVYINHNSGYHSKAPEWTYEHFDYQPDTLPIQLFNLKDDLEQRTNLAGQMPSKVEDMQKSLEEARAQEYFVE